jgi:alpha-beta hydrolase superfamily lysophospholipase
MEELAGSASPLVDAVRFSRNFWYKAPNGWRNAYAWLPPAGRPIRGTLALFHGYGEHALRYQPLGEAWAKEGFAVYAMDHAGHGENPSNGGFFGMRTVRFESLVEDALAFARHVSTELQPGAPFFLMGHSMGGMISFLAALDAHDWPNFRGLILSAPTFKLGGQGLVRASSCSIEIFCCP